MGVFSLWNMFTETHPRPLRFVEIGFEADNNDSETKYSLFADIHYYKNNTCFYREEPGLFTLQCFDNYQKYQFSWTTHDIFKAERWLSFFFVFDPEIHSQKFIDFGKDYLSKLNHAVFIAHQELAVVYAMKDVSIPDKSVALTSPLMAELNNEQIETLAAYERCLADKPSKVRYGDVKFNNK